MHRDEITKLPEWSRDLDASLAFELFAHSNKRAIEAPTAHQSAKRRKTSEGSASAKGADDNQ